MYGVIVLKFVLAVLFKPKEFNPLSDDFNPVKTISIFLVGLLISYSFGITSSYLKTHRFLEDNYPVILSDIRVYRDTGEIIDRYGMCLPLDEYLKELEKEKEE